MNLEKARELYSDYIEGTLDSAMRAAFEAELKRSPDIQSDFDSFKGFYGHLNTLCTVKVPVSLDIEDQIKQKIDLQVWEAKRQKGAGWFRGVRSAAFAAAVLAIGAVGVITIRSHSMSANQASVLPGAANGPEVSAVGGAVTFKMDPAAASSIVVTDLTTGKLLERVMIPAGHPVSVPLANQNDAASAISINVEGTSHHRIVVLPGRNPKSIMNGKGTLVSFAKALADTFRDPVCIVDLPGTAEVSWSFSGTDGRQNAFQTLQPAGLTVDRTNELLRISKH